MFGEKNKGGVEVISKEHREISLRNKRRKRRIKLVREVFKEFANSTTLHGIPYTIKKELTLTEKIFWLITFIISFIICAWFINNVWIKWVTSPVIVTVSERMVSVREVPFPSITICPQLKSRTTIYNFTGEFVQLKDVVNKIDEGLIQKLPVRSKLSSEDRKLWEGIHRRKTNLNKMAYHKLEDVALICGIDFRVPAEVRNIYPRNYSNADVVHNIISVSQRKLDLFNVCKWDSELDILCMMHASQVLTSEGLCYSINSLAAEEILRIENIHKDYPYLTAKTPARNWSLEHGYTAFDSDVYPKAGTENGAEPNFQIIMRDKVSDHDKICNIYYSGFKVYVQHPSDLPQSSLYYYAVVNSQVSSMALSFSMLTTSESLREYPAKIRQCYFPDERYLKYFKIYTASNCRLECLSNYTYERCGCVGFYMPRETSKRICTVQSTRCMRKAQDELGGKMAQKENTKCDCLPACNNIEYDAEVIKTSFNLHEYLSTTKAIFDILQDVNDTQYSKLEVYFKRPLFVSMKRSELFGLTDFLANIGGLLGVFLGFSFLSLVEPFYFLTLRLWCSLRKDLKEEKCQRRISTEREETPEKY